MSWSGNLYCYAQARKAPFFGVSDDYSSAMQDQGTILLTGRRGDPVLALWEDESAGRGYTSYIRVRQTVLLDRHYVLKLPAQSLLNKGMGAVLGALDAGLEMIPNAPDLHDDFGQPELAKHRIIRSKEKAFTRTVLRDLPLRTALLAQPKNSVTVLPSGPVDKEGVLHLVEVSTLPSAMSSDWDLGSDEAFDDEARRLARYQQSNFAKKLDEMIALAQAMTDAVTAYRMP